ncbi:MAG: hypothetical protein A2498_11625 [Lentisphaerae bacterium RIFOXYC12_FULL_60_16]|nr:MAG: hypothetical protein A2498_11625 [Lentisphaerae bacterium RIFOXYC12_FULL_60_16]OGV85896.1 MAG: hypothetical protein A2340_11395 [Lentisphaerae bacterium RIFOXYB12_FULL_60_10]
MTEPGSITLPETADIETASDAYAARFAGPAGEWMLALQRRRVLAWLAEHPGSTVLDAAGGHAQLAIPLAEAGHCVTVTGSSPECARRLEGHARAGHLDFRQVDHLHLPFDDRQFAFTVCIRFLPHCGRWRELIAELCRVTQTAVIVDYPAWRSVNVFSGLLFAAKRRWEGNTRPYALFRHRAVREIFRQNGFDPGDRYAQFFFPMVLHRMLNRPGLSAALEWIPRVCGLTAGFGSPVLARFVRKENPA